MIEHTRVCRQGSAHVCMCVGMYGGWCYKHWKYQVVEELTILITDGFGGSVRKHPFFLKDTQKCKSTLSGDPILHFSNFLLTQ